MSTTHIKFNTNFEIFVNMCWIKGPGGENIKGEHNKYHI
jgi:hypothetical protein